MLGKGLAAVKGRRKGVAPVSELNDKAGNGARVRGVGGTLGLNPLVVSVRNVS